MDGDGQTNLQLRRRAGVLLPPPLLRLPPEDSPVRHARERPLAALVEDDALRPRGAVERDQLEVAVPYLQQPHVAARVERRQESRGRDERGE
jgi:hypothetical protein